MIVIDSDVLVDSLRGREPTCSRVERELEHGYPATTVVNVFELTSGALSEQERAGVEQLLGSLTILPLDELATRTAGVLWRELEARGRSISVAECLIAAICIERRASLLTGKVERFEVVPGLRVGKMTELEW